MTLTLHAGRTAPASSTEAFTGHGVTLGAVEAGTKLTAVLAKHARRTSCQTVGDQCNA